MPFDEMSTKTFGNRMINQIMNENRKRTIAHNIVSYCVIENAEQYTDRRISVFVFGSDRCLTKSREF